MDSKVIPIAIFVFDRPDVLQETLAALGKNIGVAEHPLIFFCDGPKEDASKQRLQNIAKVADVIKQINWTNDITVYNQPKNIGLAKSIVNGVSLVFEKYESVIVLEDDIKTSSYFLKFMRDALALYKNDDRVASVTGFNYPLENLGTEEETFFLRGADCWGWATWKRGWDLFEPDGEKLLQKLKKNNALYHFDFLGTYKFSAMLRKTIKINHSWAVKWYASAYNENKLTLYPVRSLVQNIGDQGTNVKQNNIKMLGFEIWEKPIRKFPTEVRESVFMHQQISKHLGKYYNIFYRLYNYAEQRINKMFRSK